MKTLLLAASIFCLALPVLAQTPPAARTEVHVSDEAAGVETTPGTRAPVVVVATDALYGGVAGALLGGGVSLLQQGEHLQRDLTVGAGAGALVGAVFGLVQTVTQGSGRKNTVVRADADRDPSAHDTGLSLSAYTSRF